MSYIYSEPSPFPPSFDGNPWAYGFGLFGDVVAASFSLALLLSYVFEERRNKAVSRLLGNQLLRPPNIQPWSPLFLYRATIMSLLTFVVMRSLPDAVWMLAWGEVPDSTIRLMLTIDLLSHGFALFPLFFATMCWCWGRQAIPQMLMNELSAGVSGGPPLYLLWKNGRIVAIVMLIAIGVTIGKASV